MSKKQSPYRHKDGGNCWTVNCSRGNVSAASAAKFDVQRKIATQLGETFVHADVIAPIEDFYAAAERGEINRTKHPTLPYSIFKYSQATQYSKNWNDVTLASRGLVINDDTGEVVARPFSKFFNYSENATPAELMTGPVTVAEKLDGSLGISMNTPDGLTITTAGGFQSTQGAHATRLYRERYEGNWKPRKGVTYMWEIVYPENRIVVNYGEDNDIHLLGAVNNRTGVSIPLKDLKEWKWKRATEYPEFKSIEAAVSAPDRENHEGYIIHFTQTDARVKVKHDEYLQLHKMATGLNKRRIWEMMREGKDMEAFRQTVPEEYLDFVDEQTKDVKTNFDKAYSKLETQTAAVRKAVPAGNQKDIAMWVNANIPHSERGHVFTMLNKGKLEGRSLESLWDRVKPAAEKGFWLAGQG